MDSDSDYDGESDYEGGDDALLNDFVGGDQDFSTAFGDEESEDEFAECEGRIGRADHRRTPNASKVDNATVARDDAEEDAKAADESGDDDAEKSDGGDDEDAGEQQAEIVDDFMEKKAGANWEYVYVVPDAERRTNHAISAYEWTELISVRGEQIARDGVGSAMVAITPAMNTEHDIARAELAQHKCPLKIVRAVGVRIIDGARAQVVEIWSPNEMTQPR